MSVSSIKLSVAGLLLLGVALIFVSGGAEAIDPEWSYEAGDHVMSIAVSADGEYIAAGSSGDDDKLYLFDKDSSTLWSYKAGNIVRSVALSSDGEYVVAGSWDKKIYLFDKDSDTPLWHYTTDGELYSVAISADGEYIVAGNDDDKFYLFDKDSNTPLWTYSAGGAVYSVAISADGEYIAAGSLDGTVYLFDKDSSTPLWSYGIGGNVGSVSISADGEYIAAGGFGDKVYLFDKDSSTPLWSHDTGEDLLSVEISADGEHIVAGGVGDDWKVYFFDKDNSIPLWSYTAGNIVRSVDISANGDYVIAGSHDNKVYLFGKDSSTPLGSYTTGDDVYSVAISDSGQYIAVGSTDDNVYAFYNEIEEEIVLPEDGFTLEFAGEYDTNGRAWGVQVVGDLAYVSDYGEGLLSFDVSDVSDIVKVDQYKRSENNLYSMRMIVLDDYAYVAEVSGIAIYNIANPDNISYAGGYSVSSAYGMAMSGDYMYVAARSSGFVVLDISDITNITLLGSYDTYGDSYNVVIKDNLAYIADYDSLVVLDITNPSSIQYVNSYDMPTSGGQCRSVVVDGDFAYVAAGIDGLLILDISNPDMITSVGSYDSEGAVVDISLIGKYVIFSDHTAVSAVDVSDPSNPEFVTSYDTDSDKTWAIDVTNDYVYVADDGAGLVVLEIVPTIPNNPPTVSDISLSPNPAYSNERVYFSANYSDSDGNVAAFEWRSDIDGVLNTTSNFDSDDLSVGHHNISFRVQDDDGAWSDYVYQMLVIEDECSFDSFMNNIYVQSPSISGPVIDEYMLLEVGKGSYHFVSEDNVYISWETTDLSGIKLDNGLPLPSKKSFTETTFDYANRIFTGKIDFASEGGTYGGAASWDYQMIFSEDYTSIIGGQIYRIDSGDKIFYTWTFGEDENYPYCALCTLTAADYYSENPFEDPTSPDEQVTTPEDGGLTLPFSGNPLAYGAIIFILGLLGAGYAAMSARQSIPGLISELQGLVDAGISDAELISALEDLENMDGLGFFSNDRANAMQILGNYNEMTDQALGSMRQLDELQGVVDELQAAGVSSPELEAEIAEIESMLNSQVEGDTNKDFSSNLFESFRKNKGGS